MAKSKSFFGLRTGSTKSLTFQVLRGQQITKDRVYRVSNPRSEAQMAQRALIPIVAAARSELKGLVDHSFEGVAYGEPSLRVFSALNLRAGALEVTSYSPNGVSNAGFAALQVSKGTIDGKISVQNTSEEDTIYTTIDLFPKMSLPAATAGSEASKIFKYLETYGKANRVPVFTPGTQITLLSILDAGDVSVNTTAGFQNASLSTFVINRFMIPNSESGTTQLQDVNGDWKVSETIAEGASAVKIVNSAGDIIEIKWNGSGEENANISLTISTAQAVKNSNNCGGALILSRYENGTWKRSTARINIGYEPRYKYTFEDWLSVYQTTATASKKYLNNGNEGTGIQG